MYYAVAKFEKASLYKLIDFWTRVLACRSPDYASPFAHEDVEELRKRRGRFANDYDYVHADDLALHIESMKARMALEGRAR